MPPVRLGHFWSGVTLHAQSSVTGAQPIPASLDSGAEVFTPESIRVTRNGDLVSASVEGRPDGAMSVSREWIGLIHLSGKPSIPAAPQWVQDFIHAVITAAREADLAQAAFFEQMSE